MPELPEVYTMAKNLKRELKNEIISLSEIIVEKSLKNTTINEFQTKLLGEIIKDVFSYAKYLLIKTENYWIECHPRMEGKFEFGPTKESSDIFRFKFNSGRILHFKDTRKFATVNIYKTSIKVEDLPFRKKIGPLASKVTDKQIEEVFEKVQNKKIAIKSTLLDQKYISGIGNIYADEILYAVSIHPEEPTNTISLNEWKKIAKASKNILNEAIKFNGTTIRTYSSIGKPGSYQNKLKVHTQIGPNINKIKIGGRGTYYDINKQKKRKY